MRLRALRTNMIIYGEEKQSDTQKDLILSRLKYNPLTGEIVRRTLLKNGKFKETKCTSIDRDGYLQVRCKHLYTQHRIAWFLYHGEFPNGDIDHINHCRTDNRMGNIRCVSRSDNNLNIKIRGNNTSGFNGVYWHKSAGKWCAEGRINNKKIYLGVHENKISAIKARVEFNKRNGFHENHGL